MALKHLTYELVWPEKHEVHSPMRNRVELTDRIGNTQTKGWRNKLILDDNLNVLHRIENGVLGDEVEAAGGLKMIYIDPPFEVESDFYMKFNGNDRDVVSVLAYSDKWKKKDGGYLSMIFGRLKRMHSILSDDGCLIVHCDWRLNAKLRILLDEVFGSENLVNEIIWSYRSGGASRKESLPRKHDYILLYRKTEKFMIRPKLERQFLQKSFMGSKKDSDGRYYVDTLLRDVWEGELNLIHRQGIQKYNIRPVLNLSSERLDYPTQKPEGLLKLLMEITTDRNALIADFFCGSGTTLAVAEALGRKWIGADAGRAAIQTTFRRLLAKNAVFDKYGPNPKKQKKLDFHFDVKTDRRQAHVQIRNFKSKTGVDIDGWGVDFTFDSSGPFTHRWYDVRGKREKATMTSGTFVYPRKGEWTIGVKVSDVLGNYLIKTKVIRVA